MNIIIYACYVLLSAIILGVRHRKSPRDWLLRLIIVASFPGIGWLYPLFWPKRVIRNKGDEFTDYVAKQQEEQHLQRTGVYSEVNREKELGIIPIEDALLISEHATRRRVMIDVLKQDATHYLDILQKAVSNDDTETSHYAVSAIMEVKRKLLLALQDLSVQFENDREDRHVAKTYAEVLQGFMKSGFLDERTLFKYQYTYLSVLEQLIKLGESAEWAYEEKVETELALKLIPMAETTSLRFVEAFPYREEAYLCMMKVYYTMRSMVKLQQTLLQLKQSPIRLSNRALMLVRFWSEGARHAE
ncbi:hypothetical protein M6D81_19105 [Paenibacillus sp. J5C_2022]|uniref:hypothetical protein n=1 Tax=Paenibacillus sp. J5C2022 TaxID=2977129 RepID=UPI0021D11B62|nr:hypothetical protein [Paenibacillus sp. J5C2022]MCU6710805.1 hypothetical protein [Paenibacillus sp. J5C2022]